MAAKAAGFDLPAPASLPRRAGAVAPHSSIDPSESERGTHRTGAGYGGRCCAWRVAARPPLPLFPLRT